MLIGSESVSRSGPTQSASEAAGGTPPCTVAVRLLDTAACRRTLMRFYPVLHGNLKSITYDYLPGDAFTREADEREPIVQSRHGKTPERFQSLRPR